MSVAMRRRVPVPILALASLLLAAACAPEPVPQGPPNIVLLISDDHGYGDHGFMGSPVVRTPHLDRLAREGVVFSHGYSTASLCRPALATLLTGLQPLQRRIRQAARDAGRGPENEAPPLVASLATLPRLLAERGYASFQAGKYWEGPFADAGFDAGMVDLPLGEGSEAQWSTLLRETLDPVTDFVARNAERPFFVWFAPLLPHLPHDAPARFREPYRDRGLRPGLVDYYAAISWLDDGIGQLVAQVRALDLERRTLFVYLADNGWDPDGPPPLGGPRGKGTLHELGFRTPVVLRWLGGIEPQGARTELVSFTDVFVTLLDYAGLRPPPDRFGHSLRPLLEGGAAWPRRDLVGWVPRLRGEDPRTARRGGAFWRDERWHYLQPVVGPARLFDVVADPEETTDLAAQQPGVVARARDRLAAWTRRLKLQR